MNSYQDWLKEPETQTELVRESLIVAVGQELESVMEKKGVSQAELARLLGVTRSRVSKLLDGETNLTLRTLADISRVLQLDIRIKFSPSWTQMQSDCSEWNTVVPFKRHTAGPFKKPQIIPCDDGTSQLEYGQAA